MYCGHSFAAMSLFLPGLVTMHHILWQYVTFCHIISLSVTSGGCNFVITWQSSCCRPFRTAVRPSPSFAAQSFVWKNKILMKNGRKSLHLDRNLWLGKSSQLPAKLIFFEPIGFQVPPNWCSNFHRKASMNAAKVNWTSLISTVQKWKVLNGQIALDVWSKKTMLAQDPANVGSGKILWIFITTLQIAWIARSLVECANWQAH